jgi:hypothetical protein
VTSSPAGHRKVLRIPCSPAISFSPVTMVLPLCHFSSNVATAYTTVIRMCSSSTTTPYAYVVNGQRLPYPTLFPGHPRNSPLSLRLNKLSQKFGHSDLGPPGNTNWICSQSMSKEPPVFLNTTLFAILTSRTGVYLETTSTEISHMDPRLWIQILYGLLLPTGINGGLQMPK